MSFDRVKFIKKQSRQQFQDFDSRGGPHEIKIRKDKYKKTAKDYLEEAYDEGELLICEWCGEEILDNQLKLIDSNNEKPYHKECMEEWIQWCKDSPQDETMNEKDASAS